MRTFYLAGLLCLATPALAQEGGAPEWAHKPGALGIGANTTLGGSNGLMLRTWVTPQFGLQATLGFSSEHLTVDSGGTKTTIGYRQTSLGVYGSTSLASWQRGGLSALFGLDLLHLSVKVSTPFDDAHDSELDGRMGLGLLGEYFATRHLSFHLGGGLRVDLIEAGEVDVGVTTSTDQSTDDLGSTAFLGSPLLGEAGFTLWFD